jgi:uncharacterized membrane protein YvlD (DUF360 family)
MTLFILKMVARFVVFGVALTFACRRDPDVKVEPRSRLPVVAATFAVLNALLYWLLASALNFGTLFLLFFLVPFAANGLLLMLTDKILTSFKIESMTSLIKTAGIVTIAHLLLRIANL